MCLGPAWLVEIAAESAGDWEIGEGAGRFDGCREKVKQGFKVLVEPFRDLKIIGFSSGKVPLSKIGSPTAAVDADYAGGGEEMVP